MVFKGFLLIVEPFILMTETKSGLPWLSEEKNKEKNPRAKTNEPFSTATPTSSALNWPLKVLLKNHSASGEDGVKVMVLEQYYQPFQNLKPMDL